MLRNHLAEFEEEGVEIRYDDSINSTSVKQGAAALLKLVGIEYDLPFSLPKTREK